MNPITAPLGRESTGPAVVNLQDGLRRLLTRELIQVDQRTRVALLEGLADETQRRVYDDMTQKTVSIFQEQRGLRPSGEVDAESAEALNAAIAEIGGFGAEGGWDEVLAALREQSRALEGIGAETDSLPKIEARIETMPDAETVRGIRQGTDHLAQIAAGIAGLAQTGEVLSLGARGDRVRALHQSLGRAGYAVPGPELEEGLFGVGTRAALLELQQRARLARTGALDEPTRRALAVALGAAERPSRIEGRVLLENGLPAEGLALRIVDRGFGGRLTELGTVQTDARGFYALAYDARGALANLEIYAARPDGTEVQIARPKTRPDRSQVFDLVAPEAVQPLAAEYSRLAADLAPHVGELANLAGAKETADQRDLTVLNRATGWDARLIALAAVSERLCADPEVGLPQEALYGLMRAGLPTDKLLLAQVHPDSAEQALRLARDAGVVALSDERIGELKEAFGAFSTRVRLSIPAPGSRSTYGALLQASGLPATAQTRFASVYLNHQGDGAQLWQEARRAGLSEAQVARLQLQGKLAFLAGNSEALTARLMRQQISDPAQLAARSFYRAEAWLDELYAQAGVPRRRRANLSDADRQALDALIPAAFEGESVEARLGAYAADMARKVRLSYPTQVLAHRIETEAAFQLPEAHDTTVALLKGAAAQGFRLGETPVAAFLGARPEVADGVADGEREVATRQLQALQRVYQIAPSDEAMPVLMSLGLTSAFDVMAHPEAMFVELFDASYAGLYGRPPSIGLAKKIYARSKQVSSVTYNLFTIAKKLESEPPIAGLSAPVEVRESVRDTLVKQFPTMESLFGSLDYCDCEHCRSVLSPAAYLVDLLQFVDQEPGAWGNFLAHWRATHGGADYPHRDAGGVALKPYDVLVERRPDLPHIALTCENTHTAMPYIDIVNEILEYYVANGQLAAQAAHDTGEATTAELLAEPQHVIGEAYDALRAARYPLGLPFDLWLETVRQLCAFFEAPLHRVLESLRAGDDLLAPAQPFDRAAIFLEALGLSPAEAAIFGDPDPLSGGAWRELYGFAAADAAGADALRSAKFLSRRLEVSYSEITAIVQTAFVNPRLAALALLYKLAVSIQDARLYQSQRAFYEQNRDLLGAERAALSPADQARYDALAQTVAGTGRSGWAIVGELAAFEQRLGELATEHATPLDDLRAYVEGLPFDAIVVLADPDASCNFDLTTLQYADGGEADPIVFLRINLFVRLWRKLGWSIEETDRALTTFLPASAPYDADPAHLAARPLRSALLHLAQLKALDERLKVGKQSRLKLLTLWSDLATTGKAPLYAQLFLTRSVLRADPVFDHPLGDYLADPAVLLRDHTLALQGALGLTADEVGRILADAGLDPETAPLSLANVSRLYRYRLLARALKLSVAELIALKQLAGLDPFAPLHPDPVAQIDELRPFAQTLAFVEVAEAVRQSGLAVADLEYLLRHRFDPAGPYRPDREGTLAWLRGLAGGIRAIAAEHALPDDPGALSDEALRQKLGLALPSDVVAQLLAMLSGAAEFTATRAGVAPADQLAPEALAGEAAIREVRYSAARQEQKLTFRGVLFDAEKADLLARLPRPTPPNPHVPSPLLADLLDEVQRQARAFFAKHLQRQAPGVQPEGGFLDQADFALLFAPPPAGLSEAQQQERARRQRDRLARAFLPFLQQRLTRQLIVQSLTAFTGADPLLVEALLTDERLLRRADGQALLGSFAATAARGVSAAFFDTGDLAGAPQATPPVTRGADTALKATADAGGNPLGPAGSARFAGYLEVPEAGAYRFTVELDRQNAAAELRFDHLPQPLFLSGVAGADSTTLGEQPAEFLELRPGVPYAFSLELRDLGGGGARLLVQGETVPKGELSRLALTPEQSVGEAERALLLLAKTLQIAQALGLSERELRYLLTNGATFGGLDLSLLPASAGEDTPAGAAALFGQLTRLLAYARLKRDLAGGTDDLIGVFEANGAGDLGGVYARLAALTRRDAAAVQAAAEAIWPAPAFADERAVGRLWEALQVVERFGVPVAAIAGWAGIVSPAATGAQRFAIARDLREAIKARFEPEAWQGVAQPIFDRLRRRQRDALVAQIKHQRGFERVEQLYEYFLIDPGMEPVVQTSRIRLAIGSLQLFIQRCLLNLEPQVHPATINAGHWEWMKRYRVWEANRKIFLFPENWLEPEFRDDKTHLFVELEGALLQEDVSSDLVEDAFLAYLRKLDELARLEIVAMHLEDSADPARRILHVFGRTYAQPHKYFYRRYAHRMWTPWEPVGAEIEGDHLAPVVWRDRLYLFWVTFLEKAKPAQSGVKVDYTTPVTIPPAGDKELEAHLHWSEYVRGEWGTPEAAAVNQAEGQRLVATAVEPRRVFVHVSKEPYEDGAERGVFINLSWPFNQAFYLAGRNSAPERASYSGIPQHPYTPGYTVGTARATRYPGSGPLKVTFAQRITTTASGWSPSGVETREILKSGGAFTLLPCNNSLTALGLPEEAYAGAANPAAVRQALERSLGEIAALIKPVFYQDRYHALFVEPDVTERTIERWDGWVTRVPLPAPERILPEKWKEIVVVPAKPWRVPIDPDGGFRPERGPAINPAPYKDWLVNPGTVLEFDQALIGPGGQPGLAILPGEAAVGGATTVVNVNPGSAVTPGSVVALTDRDAFADSGLAQVTGGLSIVRGAGYTSAFGTVAAELDGVRA